jgi:hypothetical protein
MAVASVLIPLGSPPATATKAMLSVLTGRDFGKPTKD